MSIKLSF